jgi:hypothetical protein
MHLPRGELLPSVILGASCGLLVRETRVFFSREWCEYPRMREARDRRAGGPTLLALGHLVIRADSRAFALFAGKKKLRLGFATHLGERCKVLARGARVFFPRMTRISANERGERSSRGWSSRARS